MAEARRLPTGLLGAEPLKPLSQQVIQRFHWLGRNGKPDSDERIDLIAKELGVDRQLVMEQVY